MVQPYYEFKPVLQSNQWTIKTPKRAKNTTTCEETIVKKIKSIVATISNTQKITSIQLQGNRLTITQEGTQAGKRSQEIHLNPKECIFTLLRQRGPTWITKGMTKYQELFSLVSRLENTTSHQEVTSIYQELTTAFRGIEHAQESVDWAQKADLMDAIDLLVEKFQTTFPDIQPLEIQPENGSVPTPPAAVPLLPYAQIRSLKNRTMQENYKDLPSLQKDLGDSLVFENTGMAGRAVQFLTKQRRVQSTAYVFGLFYRIFTRLIGWAYSRSSRMHSPLKRIVNAAKKMGIRPVEILAKQVYDQTNSKFYYRGPRHLFGKSIHAFTSIDDFFRRDLTDSAREEYLGKARQMEEAIFSHYGPPSQSAISRVAISNADCRVRVRELTDFSTAQEIVGKVLTKESAETAAVEDPSYYLGTYAFTTKQLLGLDRTETLEARPLPAKASSMDAQKELLVGMARVFQEEGAVQVVQRLAPADIHNYTAPVNGTPLSESAAVDVLANRAKMMGKDQESNLLTTLRNYLSEKRTTIDIYGGLIGNASVQTGAVTNQPAILTQNDRKVMLFQHDDGSLSLHVFIGATGVNRVSVHQESIHMEQGEQQGDMGFGDETSRGKLRQGARKGGFDKEGSTVISYYLRSDFIPLDSVKQAQESVTYTQTVARKGISGQIEQVPLRKEVEILCQMGDPLLIKTEIALSEQLEKRLGESFATCTSDEKVFAKFLETQPSTDPLCKFLRKEEQDLTWSERQLKKRLSHTVKERLRILRTDKLLKELLGEDIDLAAKISYSLE